MSSKLLCFFNQKYFQENKQKLTENNNAKFSNNFLQLFAQSALDFLF